MNTKIGNGKDKIEESAESKQSQEQKKEVTMTTILGECIWLLGRSAPHGFMFVRDLDWMIYPALHKKQLFIFRNKEGQPVGLVMWAYVDDETEKRLEAGLSKLKPDEWDNGKNLWLVDFVAPFGKSDLILQEIKDGLFKGKKFRYAKRTKDGKLDIITENDS